MDIEHAVLHLVNVTVLQFILLGGWELSVLSVNSQSLSKVWGAKSKFLQQVDITLKQQH